MADLTVTEAAAVLGVDPSRVRALVASGGLPGRRVGPLWVVDSVDVDRLATLHAAGARSRPMAPRVAWAAGALLDGQPTPWISTGERSRLRARLLARRDDGWHTYSRWLASRQQTARRYRMPVVDIPELIRFPGVVVTGAWAGTGYGSRVSPAGHADVYADAELLGRLMDEFALQASPYGQVTVRVAPDDGWHRQVATTAIDGLTVAPRLMVAIDLLEQDDSRSQSAGRVLLDAVLNG